MCAWSKIVNSNFVVHNIFMNGLFWIDKSYIHICKILLPTEGQT